MQRILASTGKTKKKQKAPAAAVDGQRRKSRLELAHEAAAQEDRGRLAALLEAVARGRQEEAAAKRRQRAAKRRQRLAAKAAADMDMARHGPPTRDIDEQAAEAAADAAAHGAAPPAEDFCLMCQAPVGACSCGFC